MSIYLSGKLIFPYYDFVFVRPDDDYNLRTFISGIFGGALYRGVVFSDPGKDACHELLKGDLIYYSKFLVERVELFHIVHPRDVVAIDRDICDKG